MGTESSTREPEAAPSHRAERDAPLLNLTAAIRVLRRRAAWLLGALLLGVAAGIAIGLISPPIYRVETLLAPATNARGASLLSGVPASLAGLAGLAGVDLGGSGNTESALATLSSRGLAREFIQKESLLPVIFSEDAPLPAAAGKPNDRTYEHSIEDTVDRFLDDILFVSRDRRSGLVKMAIEWKDPATAAAWANGLVQLANDRLRLKAVADSERAVEYLSKELERNSSVEVQQSIYRIIEAQMSAAAAANASPEFAFKVVDPAVAPDADDFVRPKRAVLAVIAGLLFLITAAAGSLWSARRQLWA